MPLEVEVPKFIRDNARRGLEYHKEGKSGDGVTDKTIREARDMAEEGMISEDKVRRMGPWFERHKGDMSAPKNDPDNEDFPGAGAVAWLLWGGSTSGDKMDAAKWAERKARQLESESAFYSSPTFMEHNTIEETLAAVQANLAEAVSNRDEIAAKAVEAAEAHKAEIEARDSKIAELTAALEASTKLATELNSKVEAAAASALSASEEAAVIAASVGVAPVETNPAIDAAPKGNILEQYMALTGHERSAFFAANRNAIMAAMRS
jgi:hypothetical protein